MWPTAAPSCEHEPHLGGAYRQVLITPKRKSPEVLGGIDEQLRARPEINAGGSLSGSPPVFCRHLSSISGSRLAPRVTRCHLGAPLLKIRPVVSPVERALPIPASSRWGALDKRVRGLLSRPLPLYLLLVATLMPLSLFPLVNTDIWWHLASGEWILRHGALPCFDPFGPGGVARPWCDIHWLYQLLMLGIHRVAGVAGLVLFKALGYALVGVAAVAAASATAVDARQGAALRLVAALLVSLAFSAFRPLLLARPVVFSLLFLALAILWVERYLASARRSWLLLLFATTALWANFQALYLLALVVVVAYLMGEGLALVGAREVSAAERCLRRRTLCGLAAIALTLPLAPLLTPHGFAAMRLPFALFFRIDHRAPELFSHQVSENLPLALLGANGAPPALVWGSALLGLALFGLWLWRWRHPRYGAAILAAAAFYLALTANRNVTVFALVGCIYLARELVSGRAGVPRVAPGAGAEAPAPPAARAGSGHLASWALRVALLALLGIMGWGWWRVAAESPLAMPAPFRLPIGAVERLRGPGAPRVLFSSVRYGGYLLYRLGEQGSKVLIDGRLILRSATEFAAYLAAVDQPEAHFARYSARHQVDAVVLPSAFPGRYLGLARWLYRSSAWQLCYTEGSELLFRRVPVSTSCAAIDLWLPAERERVRRLLDRRYRSYGPLVAAQARLNFARLLALVDAPIGALEQLDGVVHPGAELLRGRIAYLAHDLQDAARIATARLRRHPHERASLDLLALVRRAQGRHAEAAALVGRTLKR